MENYSLSDYKVIKKSVLRQLGIKLTKDIKQRIDNSTSEIQIDNIAKDLIRKM